MKIILLIGCGLLGGCASLEPKVVSQTPVSIELECISFLPATNNCGQSVADKAEAHCRQYGLDAQENHVARAPSGSRWVTYNCVRAAAR